MKVIVHKDLSIYEYLGVIQINVNVSEEIKELEMPQETIIQIIQKDDKCKTKNTILCDTTTILTINEE